MTDHPVDRLNTATDALEGVMELMIQSGRSTGMSFVNHDHLHSLLFLIHRELKSSLDQLEAA